MTDIPQHFEWSGAATVPSRLGYAQVGLLMAVLEIEGRRLGVRVRPGFARRMFGIQNLAVTPSDGVVVFPARNLGQQGIEVRPKSGRSYYFWTNRSREVLACAAAAGFDVSAEEQRPRR